MHFPKNDIISLLDTRLEFNLAESTNKDLVLDEIWDNEFVEGLKKVKLEYGTSQGLLQLREKVAEKLESDKDEIVITNGALFAIFLSILCLCEQDDEVLTVQPNFPPTIDLIEGLGFKKVLLNLSFDDDYELYINELISLVTQRTRLVILVSPLNPTGTTISKEEVLAVSKHLEDNYPNCKLIVDETYREATYGNNEVIPTFAGLRDNIITISSLTKCHGSPGIRIGWLHSKDKGFIEQAAIAKMNTVISNSVLDEYVALQILSKEACIFKNRRMHSVNGLEMTRKWVEKNTRFVDWVEPKAGALCCVKLNEEEFTDGQVEDFYNLTKEQSIQIASGEWFGVSKRYFRLGFGYMELDMLEPALKKLSHLLQELSENIS